MLGCERKLVMLVSWFILPCFSSNKQLYLATDPVFRWTAGLSFYCQLCTCGVVELHPSVDYLFPNPELWKCWTFYRAWYAIAVLYYLNLYQNINELRKKSFLLFICKIYCQKASRKVYNLFFIWITSEAKLHKIRVFFHLLEALEQSEKLFQV